MDSPTVTPLACHICGKSKGQPPDRCGGHYSGTTSDPSPSNRPGRDPHLQWLVIFVVLCFIALALWGANAE